MPSYGGPLRVRVVGRAQLQLVGLYTLGKIKMAESSRMGHETADKRIYCHEALHLREKLQSTGYKQETSRRPSTTPRPRPTWLCSGEMSPQGISLGHVFTVWTAVVNTDISQSVPAEIHALSLASSPTLHQSPT